MTGFDGDLGDRVLFKSRASSDVSFLSVLGGLISYNSKLTFS